MQFDESEKLIEKMLEDSPKERSRHHLRSALHHIRRADTLLNIDRPMAVFRGLTAVEEAASGVILCVRERGYGRSEELDWKKHLHKNAFIPFLKVLGESIEKHLLENGVAIEITVRETDGRLAQLLDVTFPTPDGPLCFCPVPPFDIKIESHGVSISFEKEMKDYAQKVGIDSVLAHVKRLMNWRNQVLYAGTQGYVADVDNVQAAQLLNDAKKWVFVLARLYLMIHPYPPQAFVQHSLNALLDMLKKPRLVAASDMADA